MAGIQILNNNAVTSGQISANKHTPHWEILVSHSALFCNATPCCLVYIYIYIYIYIYKVIPLQTRCGPEGG